MNCPRVSLRALLLSGAVALAVLLPTPIAWAGLIVKAGSSLLQSAPGTSFAGQPFQGVPLGSFDFGGAIGTRFTGPADTIVQRLGDASVVAVGDSVSIPIELVALQLVSVNPIDLGAGVGLYYVTLQKVRGGPASFGRMTIHFGPEASPADPHGTFDSFFDVFFDIRLGSLDGPIILSDSLQMSATGLPWNHFPPPGVLEILGVNTLLNGQNRDADFWPLGVFTHSSAGGFANYAGSNASILEPSSLLLAATGLLAVLGIRGRRLLLVSRGQV